ncbi:MAG TPA: AMP-binding protein, partial [Gemmatimonadaceae bacterium]|nr:AMP-binding protein [Gemmatimonadaceae bacterium]
MSNPLAYLPLALAGAGGTLNDVPVRRLVAAGVALLQRSAALVRALMGHRAAILLPPSPAFVVALTASEGRGAVLLDPEAEAGALAESLGAHDVAAVFTSRDFADRLPAGVPLVLLDDAPDRATWRGDGGSRVIDLALHGGLHLSGESDEPGADEEALVTWTGDAARDAFGASLSHRRVMASAVATGARERLGPRDHTLVLAPSPTLFPLVVGMLAPLMAGGRVTARERLQATDILGFLETGGLSGVVAPAVTFAAVLDAVAARGRPLDAPVLQRCLAGRDGLDDALAR